MSPFDSILNTMHCKTIGRIAAILALVAHTFPAAAQHDILGRTGITQSERALLPPYCSATQGTKAYEGSQGDYWRSIFGSDLQHFHHYCRGMRDAILAKTMVLKPHERKFLWERSINEFNYMIRNCNPRMVLIPEIYLRRAQSQIQLSRIVDAQLSLETAVALKPDYVAAYIVWANWMVDMKLPARAIAVLEAGLHNVPDDPLLQEHYKKLSGGKLPPPRPDDPSIESSQDRASVDGRERDELPSDQKASGVSSSGTQ